MRYFAYGAQHREVISTYAIFWFALAVVAVVNGLAREATYGRKLSDLRAHQLSTLSGMLLSGIAVWMFSLFFPIESGRTAMLIGILWLGSTVVFEFGFGRFVARHSWRKLFSDYDLFSGRVWCVFLVWILFLPYIVYRLGARAA